MELKPPGADTQFVDVDTSEEAQAGTLTEKNTYFDLDMSPPGGLTTQPSTDPNVVARRATKANFAMEAASPGYDSLVNQMANGNEPELRQALAASKSLEDRKLRLGMVQEMARTINRPLKPQEADELMGMATGPTARDPATALEEMYGEWVVKTIPSLVNGQDIHQEGLNKMPWEYLDAADAAVKLIARNQIAKTVLEDAEHEWKQTGIGGTVLAYAKQLVPFWAYANLTGAVDKAPITGGVLFGDTIGEEVQYLYSLRPSEFKTQLELAVRKIAQDSPLDALMFAQGVINYSSNDRLLDNTFGAMDMTALLPFLKPAKIVEDFSKAATVAGKIGKGTANVGKSLGQLAAENIKARLGFQTTTEVAKEGAPTTAVRQAPLAPASTSTTGYYPSDVKVVYGPKETTWEFTPEGRAVGSAQQVGEAQKTAQTINLNLHELAEKVIPAIDNDIGFYTKAYEGGKDALYSFMRGAGVTRSLLGGSLHDEVAIDDAVRALIKDTTVTEWQDQKALAYLDDRFSPWPTYKYKEGDAVYMYQTGERRGVTFEGRTVGVDPAYIQDVIQPLIKKGTPLYKSKKSGIANVLPKFLADDFNALVEFILWHETAHSVVKQARGQTTAEYENIINSLALTKLYKERLKPGLQTTRNVFMGQSPEPIPYTIKNRPKPTAVREPPVVERQPTVVEKTVPTVAETPKPTPAVSDTVHQKVEDAYLKISEGNYARRVRIADLREQMPDLSHEQFNKEMLRLQNEGKLVLYKLDVPAQITARDKAAVIKIGNEDRHLVYMSSDTSPNRTTVTQTVPEAKPTPPRGQGYAWYDEETRQVIVDRESLTKQYELKAWRKMGGQMADDDFANAEDWITFNVEKAKIKQITPKRPGTTLQAYEALINEMALNELYAHKAEQATKLKNSFKATSRSGMMETGEETLAEAGMSDAAVGVDVYGRARKEWRNLDPLDDSKNLIKLTPSIFNVDEIGTNGLSLTKAKSDRVMAALRRNAETLLGIPLNNSAIVRLPAEALQKAIAETTKTLKDTYTHVNDAFLDVSFGGPISVTRPEDQLVNTTVVHLRMGKADGSLFDNPAQAALFGTDMYGLRPNQFSILQQGDGFYINIAKSVDETLDSVRDLVVTSDNVAPKGMLSTFMGYLRSPDDLLSKLSNNNRQLATTAAQEIHRIFLESSKVLRKELTKQEKSQLNDIWVANRNYEDEATGLRGMFHTTIGEFEDHFFSKFRQQPSEKQIEAYFTYTQLYDMDYILRNLSLHRDLARMGAEKTTIFYQTVDELGQPVNKSSRPFAGRLNDRIPWEDGSEDFGVWVYDPTKKGSKGEFYLRSQLTQDVRDELDKNIKDRGFKVVEVVNPLEKPLLDVAGTNETIHFAVVKNYENAKFDWNILPYRPGGHVEYGDKFFIKQPNLRRSNASGSLRHIYEGDTSLLSVATEAEARRYSQAADDARILLRDNKMDSLKTFLYQNLPYDLETFKSFFTSKELKDGTIRPALLHIDDPITWTAAGRNTSDMEHFKGAFRNYEGFFNGVRSKYNLFAQNVDKKYLGSRDPDLPRVVERGTEESPLFQLDSPRLLSPLDTLNKAIANVSRSRHMNDFKTTAVETFINEFSSVMKTPIEELRRNPVYYFHNPVWDTETKNKALLAAAQNTRRANIMFIGAQSDLGSKMTWLQNKIVDSIYENMGQKASNYVTANYLPTAKDPFTYARSIAFHSKLGLFNVVQLPLQAQSFVHVMALAGPKMAIRAAGDGILMRMLALTEDEGVINQFARWSSNQNLFRESYAEMKKTGYYNVGGEVAWRDDVFDQNLFKSKVGTFLEKGTMFFDEGERFVRLSAWNSAYYAWRDLNPTKVMDNAARNEVLKRADLMAANMTRSSNAAWQQGIVGIPTQFLAFQARLAEQMLPGWGSRLKAAEKRRAYMTYAAVYGVPVAGGAGAGVWPYYDDIRQAALERGWKMDNVAIQAIHDGILSTMTSLATGKQYNVSERYGPGGTSLFKEALNGDKKALDLILGASGSIIGDMIKSAEPATAALMSLFDENVTPPTMEDFIDVTRNISTINNTAKAWYLYNQGRYFTRNGTVVTDNATGLDAFMAAVMGLTPRDVTDTFLMIKSRKEQRAAEDAAVKEVQKWYRKAIQEYTDDNEELGNNYLKRAKAWLASSGINPSKHGAILRGAVKGHENLFTAVRTDFWKKAPVEQSEDRRQMIEGQSEE